MSSKAEYLVVDSGGFLKNAPLRELGNNLVTLKEVVGELRDKETRQRMEVMPFDITYMQPSAEAVKKVSDFARKTGDYASLSAVDIRVLAVTYELEVEKVGTTHLRTEPLVKKTTEFYHPKVDKAKLNKNDAKLPGFYMDKEGNEGDETDSASFNEYERHNQWTSIDSASQSENFDQFNYWREPLPDMGDFEMDVTTNIRCDAEPGSSLGKVAPQQVDLLDKFLLNRPFFSGFEVSRVDFAIMNFTKDVILNENLHSNLFRWCKNVATYDILDFEDVDMSKLLDHIELNQDIVLEDVLYGSESIDDSQNSVSDDDHGYDSNKESGDSSDDYDDDGWITPGNVRTKKAVFTGTDGASAPEKVTVACMTTDFAMQNVCKQLGLNIIGTNGMIIKETKTWILRCYGCFKTTSNMDKKFCPKCGNKTLKRVSVTVNPDGSQQIHISTRRPLSSKGKKFSLPAPKGGKHAVNPKLVEDQREAQQRLSKKALQRNNPMGEDYLAGSSPFITKDVTSKSAMLGLHGAGKGNAEVPGAYWARRNPNAVKKNTGNRKNNSK